MKRVGRMVKLLSRTVALLTILCVALSMMPIQASATVDKDEKGAGNFRYMAVGPDGYIESTAVVVVLNGKGACAYTFANEKLKDEKEGSLINALSDDIFDMTGQETIEAGGKMLCSWQVDRITSDSPGVLPAGPPTAKGKYIAYYMCYENDELFYAYDLIEGLELAKDFEDGTAVLRLGSSLSEIDSFMAGMLLNEEAECVGILMGNDRAYCDWFDANAFENGNGFGKKESSDNGSGNEGNESVTESEALLEQIAEDFLKDVDAIENGQDDDSPITPLGLGKMVAGSISGGDDPDVYSLTVRESGTYMFEMIPLYKSENDKLISLVLEEDDSGEINVLGILEESSEYNYETEQVLKLKISNPGTYYLAITVNTEEDVDGMVFYKVRMTSESSSADSTAAGVYIPGTYSATAKGLDEVTVTMTFDDNSITDVKVDVSKETPQIGGLYGDELAKMIMDAQSAEIDVIATATLTSIGARKAAEVCIAQAKSKSAAEETEVNESGSLIIKEVTEGLSAPVEKDIAVGDIIKFGNYEQDNNPDNGKEKIEWQVLEVQDNKALLISCCALDCQRYNTEETDVTWETCSLRSWLNSTFLNTAFSEEEQKAILTTSVNTPGDSIWNTDGGRNTEDKVFLLSYAEVGKYFSSDTARICKPTAYAIAQNAFTSDSGNCNWWLRSPGHYQDYASYVHLGGYPGYGINVNYDDNAVRPAFWIDLESAIF